MIVEKRFRHCWFWPWLLSDCRSEEGDLFWANRISGVNTKAQSWSFSEHCWFGKQTMVKFSRTSVITVHSTREKLEYIHTGFCRVYSCRFMRVWVELLRRMVRGFSWPRLMITLGWYACISWIPKMKHFRYLFRWQTVEKHFRHCWFWPRLLSDGTSEEGTSVLEEDEAFSMNHFQPKMKHFRHLFRWKTMVEKYFQHCWFRPWLLIGWYEWGGDICFGKTKFVEWIQRHSSHGVFANIFNLTSRQW